MSRPTLELTMSVIRLSSVRVRARAFISGDEAAVRPVRVLLYPGEAHRAAAPYTTLRVFSGTAYVTHAGRDIVLHAGDRLVFEPCDAAVVMPLKADPLVVLIS
jgi:hypothetical protein